MSQSTASLWTQMLEWDNLFLAFRNARRGKRQQSEIQHFELNLEYELTDIRHSLQQHRYQPGSFRQFHVTDRKTRLISAAPFRDRVVQHALMNIAEPIIDRHFIKHSYASRKNKGVHRAVQQYQAWAKQYRYALKIDIRRYFDSIDHLRLKQKLRRFITDADILWLFDRIIDSSLEPLNPAIVRADTDDLVDLAARRIGLPLGNLTSQCFGNIYLNDLDHFIQTTLNLPAYLRYVDDMLLCSNSKTQLWENCAAIEQFLATERIGIHPRKKLLVPVMTGLDVLGYRVFPSQIRLARGSGYRFRRKLKRLSKAYHEWRITLPAIKPHVAGWLGHARQADSQSLCRAIFSEVYLHRGDKAQRSPGGARRFLEQQSTEPALG